MGAATATPVCSGSAVGASSAPMALDWRDTGGSQFFIALSPAPHLDARYTVFGTVVAGMEVVDRLLPYDVIRRVRIRDGVNPE